MKKVVKKTAKKPLVKSKKKVDFKKTRHASGHKIKPATIELSSIHGTAGAIIPVPSTRLFTNSRRDARIAFNEKNN